LCFVSFQAAYARGAKIAEKKWKEFVEQINSEHLSDEQIKILIHNLDGRKQWAAIHYAVDADNIYVFNQLTACDKLYRCSIYSFVFLYYIPYQVTSYV
jgi:hypothetical protein